MPISQVFIAFEHIIKEIGKTINHCKETEFQTKHGKIWPFFITLHADFPSQVK